MSVCQQAKAKRRQAKFDERYVSVARRDSTTRRQKDQQKWKAEQDRKQRKNTK